MSYKLGSLFDGSGGFPLAGTLCGIEPVWAAEIEPYPIAVTRLRFPNMKHLGDISKVNGAKIEPVDIITFGSPCQDLSVAGKRAGLKHEANGDEETTRSGLFMEAVRIIKEMRRATNGKYPRFALWENVPGAFSSNKGEDFKVVLEEIIKIVEPSAVMPEVPQKGWNYADSYSGDGWSLAYRVLDAQYWGVPQRRRRIYLVADLRGECARKVLFERNGLRGYFTKGRTPWQDTSSDAKESFRADDSEGGIHCLTPWDSQTRRCYGTDGAAPSLCAGAETSGQNQQSFLVPVEGRGRQLDDVIAIDKESFSSGVGFKRAPGIMVGGPCATLQAQGGPHAICYPQLFENHGQEVRFTGPLKVAPTAQAGYGEGGSTKPLVIEQRVNFIDVEMEVATRKYEVDTEKLVKVLREHKGSMTNKAIAKALNCPLTQVEHWFRTDSCFAVPDPEVWFPLKALLGITTEEFDESIMTFEYKGGTYDMRNRIHMGKTAPTLTCGIGNALHLLPSRDPIAFAANQRDEVRDLGDKSGALQAEPGMKQQTFIAEPICLQGNGIDRSENSGCNGKGWKEGASYTLNTMDRPAVAYGLDRASFNQGQNAKFDFTVIEDSQPTLTARGPGAVCVADHPTPKVDEKGIAFTLSARDYKNPEAVAYDSNTSHLDGNADKVGSLCVSDYKGVGNQYVNDGKCIVERIPQYIVRRLTPTECARLQGFADGWGHIDKKKKLSAEELQFWSDVRNVHAAINGKAIKDYTEKQMLTWYNKLWTDSAEYKMWGNGIALPTALYAMQGISDALNSEATVIEDWML